MAYYTDGITDVQVTARIDNAEEAFVTWASTNTTKLHQVYVNGSLVYSSQSLSEPYQAVVTVTQGANHIGILAVDQANRETDYSSEFAEWIGHGNRVKLQWLGYVAYGHQATFNVYTDNQTGTVDYATAINQVPIKLFPEEGTARGFGLNRMGYGGFGYDGENAPGFGIGAFGQGDFGFDIELISFTTDKLADGTHKFAVKALDAAGNPSATATEKTAYIDQFPQSPKGLQFGSFYEGDDGPELVLNWTASPDIT